MEKLEQKGRERERTQERKCKDRGLIQELPNLQDSRKNWENRGKEIIQQTTHDKLPAWETGVYRWQDVPVGAAQWVKRPTPRETKKILKPSTGGRQFTHSHQGLNTTHSSRPQLQQQKLEDKSGARTPRQREKITSNLEFYTQPQVNTRMG